MATFYQGGEMSGEQPFPDMPPILPSVVPFSSAPMLFSMSDEERLNRRRPLTKKVRASLGRPRSRGHDATLEDALADKIVDLALEGNPKMIELVWSYSDGKPMQEIDFKSDGHSFTGITIIAPTEQPARDAVDVNVKEKVDETPNALPF